ncbi:MAG: hypothetical protein J6Y37_02040 [Paludibacteraceae bacterium]|nr:hypothetical protein [Paludibacteraceae bacterium]
MEDDKLTKEWLLSHGFSKIYEEDDEPAFLYRSEGCKVIVDLAVPSACTAYNEKMKRSYSGAIETMADLKMVLSLCRIPNHILIWETRT